jgi:hypothetical protein
VSGWGTVNVGATYHKFHEALSFIVKRFGCPIPWSNAPYPTTEFIWCDTNCWKASLFEQASILVRRHQPSSCSFATATHFFLDRMKTLLLGSSFDCPRPQLSLSSFGKSFTGHATTGNRSMDSGYPPTYQPDTHRTARGARARFRNDPGVIQEAVCPPAKFLKY